MNRVNITSWHTILASILIAGSCFGAPPADKRWTLIHELSDEFNGASIDKSKWDDHNPRWQGRPPGLFSMNNVRVSDGLLQLFARSEALSPLLLPYRNYTTSAVKSKKKVLYGYFEVRAKPASSRIASSFWFYDHQSDHWTEIDVFEIGAGAPGHERAYHTNAHVFHLPTYKGTVSDHLTHPGTTTVTTPLSDDYRIYGLEWSKTAIKWYIDDKLVRTLENRYWHYPLHMNFDMETMPSWFGLPEPNELPAVFSIDFVRSWVQVE